MFHRFLLNINIAQDDYIDEMLIYLELFCSLRKLAAQASRDSFFEEVGQKQSETIPSHKSKNIIA